MLSLHDAVPIVVLGLKCVDERTANPYAGEETKSRQCLARQTHDPRRFPAKAKPVGVGRCNLALVVRLIAFGIDLNVSFNVGLDFSPDNPDRKSTRLNSSH